MSTSTAGVELPRGKVEAFTGEAAQLDRGGRGAMRAAAIFMHTVDGSMATSLVILGV